MKGLYMVDADRGFVQYFENLLFTHSKEYKMLGHNFKANEFLLKIKERPDLLDKIDLLFINPKLNDLNGLELYKKIQSKRKDINVCILVNENIKTFYENDIAELGIENVILYPNSDEYYLESVKEIFEKIENKNKFNLVGQSNAEPKRNDISDKDLFSELNSDDFLSQFDFDSLTSDMFSDNSNSNKEEEIKKEEPKNVVSENAYQNIDYTNPYAKEETPIEYNNYDSNLPVNDGFNSGAPSFITPNFGFEDEKNKKEDIFDFNEPEFKDNSYEKPSYGFGANGSSEGKYGFNEPFNQNIDNSYGFDNPLKQNIESNYGFNGFDEPSSEESYEFNKPYNQNQSLSPSRTNNGDNPLDLSAFGVGTGTNEGKNNFNIFESPEFDSKPSNNEIFGASILDNQADIFSNNYGNTDYLDMDKPSVPDFLNQPVGFDSDDFEAPYENKAINQKSNLQNINRPDIDSIDNFSNYGEQPRFENNNTPVNPNSPVGGNGYFEKDINKQQASMGRHAGFNNPTNPDTGFGFEDPNRNIGGFQEPANKANPYDEYLNLGKKIEEGKNNTGFNNFPTPNDFSAPKVEEKPFGGFDFGKPTGANSPSTLNGPSGFGSNPAPNISTGGYPPQVDAFSSPKVSYDDTFDNPKVSYDDTFDNTSNKSYIENMYNKVGVDDLNYAPSGQNNAPMASPIRHERTADSSYNQVPDFARQIVAFYSTKGGIGKTSLAVNATIELAKYSKKKICLIDFDLTNANVHTHLGILDSTYDLSVVSNFESEIDSFSLSRIVTPYRVKDKNGETVEFDVIVGFKEMKMAQRFSEKEVYKILSILEEMYDIVIVDTHPVYTDLAVSTILKKATKIIFVTEQEMTALNGAKDFILASKKYNIPSDKLFMVLNRYKAQTSIFNKNRIEKGLNKTVLATIPFDMDSLRDAVNTNNPVTISNPDSELARAYIDVAKIIDTKLVIPEESKGFFKLFKK